MKHEKSNKVFKYLFIFLVALLLLFVGSGQASAGDDPPPSGLFDAANEPVTVQGRIDSEEIVRSRYVTVDLESIEKIDANSLVNQTDPVLTFNLFEDQTLVGIVDTVDASPSGGTSWTGTITNREGGYFFLVLKGNVLMGHFAFPDGIYEISWAAANVYRITEIDQSKLQNHDTNSEYPVAEIQIDRDAADAIAPLSGSAIIDVLIVYTDDARAGAGSTAAIQAHIDAAIIETNSTYSSSGINVTLNLVHTAEVSYAEAGMTDALYKIRNPTDGHLDQVHTLRQQYKADIVILVIENQPGICGQAFLNAGVTYAFGVVRRSGCLTGYYVLAHEIGHIQGAHHDKYVANNNYYSYGHGYVNVTNRWRTVMSYNNQCQATYPYSYCTILKYWSNPTRAYGGKALGVYGTSENYRVLNANSPIIGTYGTKLPTFSTGKLPSGNISDRTPRFVWTKVPDATHYILDVKLGSTLVYTKWVDASSCGTTNCSTTPANVLAYKQYNWQVRPVWNGNAGDYSRSTYFKIINTAPVPKSPTGNIRDRTPTFSWIQQTGATKYKIQLRTGTSIVYTKTYNAGNNCGATNCAVTSGVVLGYKNYKWRVRAYVNGKWSNWSAYKNFETIKTIPVLKSPINEIMDRTPRFVWTKKPQVQTYQLQLKRGTQTAYTLNISPNVCGGTNCAKTPGVTLPYGNYKWHVRVRVGGVWGPWSQYKLFSITDFVKPKLKYIRREVETNGVTHWIGVSNWAAYPDSLFVASPNLPACGLNKNASRTWVRIYDNLGNYIYGYCAFNSASALQEFWFYVGNGQCPPDGVYIVIYDRLRNKTIRSNTLNTSNLGCSKP